MASVWIMYERSNMTKRVKNGKNIPKSTKMYNNGIKLRKRREPVFYSNIISLTFATKQEKNAQSRFCKYYWEPKCWEVYLNECLCW